MATTYQKIYDAIDNRQAIQFKYKDDAAADEVRQAIPYVLGESDVPDSDPVEKEKKVLCYQYSGKGTSVPNAQDKKNWRCVTVQAIQAGLIPINAPTSFPLYELTGRERNRQNCVQDIDIFRRR